ncbi:DUF3344 domain-containing protein [Methanofollis formosanus]|uniref:DUF3344 domain-containing protein n=1 Tax=Methanofollis formosanus TaxID=299308 RepID=A0A8G1A3B7_9EURY|nr:DUF3344 domain-containing protein [Methanofollis formosanus]QYZ79958.1 DUF3344 domain-containing protein [Methanofollis formosanus]
MATESRSARAAVFLTVLLLTLPACVAADQYVGGIPLTTVDEGVVSGGVYVNSFVGTGMDRDVSKKYTLPEYTEIKWARLYVSVYCAHMQNNYEHRATVKFDGGSGTQTLEVEELRVPYSFPIDGGSGPVWVNEHCNRVTSDYLMWYDVTDAIKKREVVAKVKVDQPEGYTGTFDGRIKIVTLVVAYDDGDSDEVYYWVNQGHDVHSYYVEDYLGETYEGETTFATGDLPEDDEREYVAELSLVHMASKVGEFTFNSESIEAPEPQGAYSGYHTEDVTDLVLPWSDSLFTYTRDLSVSGSGGGYLGAYFKIPLAVLSVRYPGKEVGNLEVTSSPAGAVVYLDDEETQWVTNTTISGVEAGEHAVRVELDERYHASEDQWIEVRKGENTTVHFDLEARTGSIEVTSEPSGAWIYLEGGDYQEMTNTSLQTPATIDGLIIGKYTVEVRKEGYEPAYQMVVVQEDEIVGVDLTFGSSGGDSGGSDGEIDPEFGYTGKRLDLFTTGTLHGNLTYHEFSDYTGLIHAGESREFAITIPAPENGTVRYARLYIYTTWGHDEKRKEGTNSRITLKVDGVEIKADKVYRDRKNEGIYNYLLETHAYNISGIKGGAAGDHMVTVTNDGRKDDVFATYGPGVLVMVEDPAAPEITYWIAEGSDTLYANPDFGTTSDDCITTALFDGEINLANTKEARLILVTTAGSGEDDDEHRITFNEGEWFNLLTGGSSAISVAGIDVRPYLMPSENEAGIQSYITSMKGDYMENRGIILVVRHGTPPAGAPVNVTSAANLSGTQGMTSTGSSERFTLNESNERLEATHLTFDEGAVELFISEGTVITDGAGKPLSALRLEVLRPGDALRAYAIGDDDMVADIPLLLVIHTDRLGLSGVRLVRYDDSLDQWQPVEADVTDGSLSARIRQGGIYALMERGEDCDHGIFQPLFDLIGGFVTAFFGIFGIDISGEASVPSPDPAMMAGNLSGQMIAPTAPVETPAVTPAPTQVDVATMQFALSILSTPPGALIDLDGEYTGRTTPATLESLSGGTHTIRMSMDRFEPVEETVYLERDDEIHLQFESGSSELKEQMVATGPLRGWEENRHGGVYVESFPEGAEIYVDGRKSNKKTPALVYGLKEGLHTIKVKMKNVEFANEKERVWIVKNSVSLVKFSSGSKGLERSLSIESEGYSGSPFSVNGRYLGYKLPKNVDVVGIDAYVTVHDNGSFFSQKILNTVQSNETVVIGSSLTAPCGLLVTSVPSGALIFIDGLSTGYATPYLVENISEGRHLVSLSKPGYIPEGEVVLLTDNRHKEQDAEVGLDLGPYAYGSLTVGSTPEGAKIYLYGKDTGEKTPHTFHYLGIGSYDVKVVGKEGSKTLEDVVVVPYEMRECHVDLAAG